jgi:hypothetical protein
LSIATPHVPRELHEDTSEPALLTDGERAETTVVGANQTAYSVRFARPIPLNQECKITSQVCNTVKIVWNVAGEREMRSWMLSGDWMNFSDVTNMGVRITEWHRARERPLGDHGTIWEATGSRISDRDELWKSVGKIFVNLLEKT